MYDSADARREAIEAIHATPTQIVLVVTGGGATAMSDLLAVPGASRTVLETVVPYARTALADWLDGGDGRVTERTAEEMARAALRRARELAGADADVEVAGVASTAALATDRDRRGADRAHLCAVASDGWVLRRALEFDRSDGRAAQEREVADAVIALVAAVCEAG